MTTLLDDKTYLRSDISRVLRSLGKSNSRMTELTTSRDAELFHQGFISALIAVAEAFGIDAMLDEYSFETMDWPEFDLSPLTEQSSIIY